MSVFISDLSVGIIEMQKPPGSAIGLEACGYVNPFAGICPTISITSTNIDAYAELNAIVRGTSACGRHTALNIDRTAHRVHNAIELG